jgi:hypothetical protein
MVGMAAMSNDDDTDPTIEVRSLSPLERIELQAALDEASSTPSGRTLESIAEDAGLFEPVSPEVREAILQILRACAKVLRKPAPDSPGPGPNAGQDGSGNAEPPRPE